VFPRRERRGGGRGGPTGSCLGVVFATGRPRGRRGRLRCAPQARLGVSGVALFRRPRLVNASSGDFHPSAGVEGSLGTMPEGKLSWHQVCRRTPSWFRLTGSRSGSGPSAVCNNLTEGETFRVRVFRDHPEWDKHEKWWMLPVEFFICYYDCEDQAQLDWIAKEHSEAVFIY